MNILSAEVQHIFFIHNKVDKFSIQIDNSTVIIWSNDKNLYIEINGEKTVKELEGIMLELFSLFFICLGGYAKIIKIVANGKSIDISQYAGKFDTWEYFIKNNLAVCQINKDTINEKVLQKFRSLKQMPLYSLQYLVSNNYKSVIINHKITLLLHIIDGLISDSKINPMKKEIISRFNIHNNIGGYKPKAYFLCKNYFFKYHIKYNCEILSLLKVNEYEFVEVIADTRNWYSHFLADNNKTNRLRDGAEMLTYFEIIYYAIRLYFINQIGVSANEEWIKEYFYSIHDWILEIKYNQKKPLKSQTYKILEGFKEMRKMVKSLTENTNEIERYTKED